MGLLAIFRLDIHKSLQMSDLARWMSSIYGRRDVLGGRRGVMISPFRQMG